MSSGGGEVDSSDGEVSAPEDWPTAGVERSMLSMWPGVCQCSLFLGCRLFISYV